jgi:hypothetical protein
MGWESGKVGKFEGGDVGTSALTEGAEVLATAESARRPRTEDAGKLTRIKKDWFPPAGQREETVLFGNLVVYLLLSVA